jgi:hypothetical protein
MRFYSIYVIFLYICRSEFTPADEITNSTKNFVKVISDQRLPSEQGCLDALSSPAPSYKANLFFCSALPCSPAVLLESYADLTFRTRARPYIFILACARSDPLKFNLSPTRSNKVKLKSDPTRPEKKILKILSQ